MKLSIFTSMTNPEERNDAWQEAISCYEDIADEVIIVGDSWPEEFKFDLIGVSKLMIEAPLPFLWST